jgi:hypothetical protein
MSFVQVHNKAGNNLMGRAHLRFLWIIWLTIATSPPSLAGLVRVPENSTSGVFVFYATSPGSEAFDGPGDHGAFTAGLLHVLEQPGLNIQDLGPQLVQYVRNSTQNAQIPWVRAGPELSQPFYFSRPGPESRRALVIGNSAYRQNLALRNPKNDAGAMATLLKKQGFKVQVVLDADYKDMSESIVAFLSSLTRDGVALFYFAGHGIQIDGQNYILPVDVDPATASTVKFTAIDLDGLTELMARKGNLLNILFVDASRGHPFQDSIGELPGDVKLVPSTENSGNNSAALNLQIGEILTRLFASSTFVGVPSEARAGEPIELTLELAKNNAIDTEQEEANLNNSLNTLSEKSKDKIKFANSLKATIVCGCSKMTPIKPEEQVADAFEATTWKWSVTPDKAGPLLVHLNVDSMLSINERILPRSIWTKDTTITVKDLWLRRIIEFFTANWPFLTTTFAVPIFAWWWTTRKSPKT